MFTLIGQAQVAPAKQWDKVFGGNDIDGISSLQQTSDGGFILGGTSSSTASGDKSQPLKGGTSDYWIIKLNANGNKLWDKTFGGNFWDALKAIKQTADGGYILGGWSDSGSGIDKSQPSQGGIDFWIIRLDSNGNKLWDKTFGGNSDDYLFDLKQTSDGGYILGGQSASGISGDKTQQTKGGWDYWVIKLDANGTKVWDKTIGGNGYDFLYSLIQSTDGGYILAGDSDSGINGDKTQPSQGIYDFWIIKLDGSGNKIWDKTYGGNEIDRPASLEQTSDGGIIVGGWSASDISGDKTQPALGSRDFWVLRLNNDGNKIWDRSFGGNQNDDLTSLKQTTDGGFLLGGYSTTGVNGDKTQPSQGMSDCWIVKISTNGNKLWDKTLGGNINDAVLALQQTSDGGFILGCNSTSQVSGDKSQPSQGNSDFWIIKLGSDILGTNNQEIHSILSISPNPTQGKFKLQFSNLNASKAEVTVSDLLGRVVLQKQLQITNNQLSEELTLPNPKGIYLLQVKVGNQTTTRKIVVQ